MTPSRPHLLRALYDWIVENNCTPQIVVDAAGAYVEVPPEAVNDGQVVLNISPTAVRDFMLEQDYLSFHARFRGISKQVYVPMASVTGIFARENGRGMAFSEEEGLSSGPRPSDPDNDDPPPTRPTGGRPNLKVVK